MTYQVTVHCRVVPARPLPQSIFMTDMFPPRPFWIWVTSMTPGGAPSWYQLRSADISETTESGTKRIFRKIYTVSMLAEIPQDRHRDAFVTGRCGCSSRWSTADMGRRSTARPSSTTSPTRSATFTQQERERRASTSTSGTKEGILPPSVTPPPGS